MASKRILLLEPFYGGSHRQLIDFLHNVILQEETDAVVDKVVMSDKKWHWRMRTSALYFAEHIEETASPYSCVFVSAVTNLAELLGLRPDLMSAHKVLYFHENQLVYPVRNQKDRDFQHGYSQIISCLAADKILFNSYYNKTTFLDNINSFFNLMPDHRTKHLSDKIAPKCEVLYFPLSLCLPVKVETNLDDNDGELLHIVWAHRWEHDKNPEELFEVLFRLHGEFLPFKISILGQEYTDIPEIFHEAKTKLSSRILNWGYQPTKEDYWKVLTSADVAISTAKHEFFGVSMLEAVSSGCYPLCPNRLVYPEFFPADYLYNTCQQLYKKLKNFCKRPDVVRKHKVQVDMSRFDCNVLKAKYLQHIMQK